MCACECRLLNLKENLGSSTKTVLHASGAERDPTELLSNAIQTTFSERLHRGK